MMTRIFRVSAAAISILVALNIQATEGTFPVTIRVHADKPTGQWRATWRFFGADEPNYATMPDGRKLLGELGRLAPGRVYFRTHNLLNTGNGIPALKWGSTDAYTEDPQGNPVYNWTIMDRIFDTYRASDIRPYVEIGFMPEALSTKPEPYQHHWHPGAKYGEIFTGWAYPPKNYAKWSDLVYHWAQHESARYGQTEVAQWYWETWNEANIGYWQGTPQEFFKLHDYAVDAVRRAIPAARVGGPDSAGAGLFLRRFIEHCLHGTNFVTGRIGTPLDFVSFHAKGSPGFTNGSVQLGIQNQLRDINSGFRIVSSFPELKKTPIVIGESDPDGCAACQGDSLGYRTGPAYACYTAECIAREFELADRYDVNLEGALTWAFEFENQPLFAGFRVLASGGVDMPVLNVFRMFAKMDGRQVAADSDGSVSVDAILKNGVRERPDVSALASLKSNRLCILVWHYDDNVTAGPVASVNLALNGLPANISEVHVSHFRIDNDHSDAFTAWQRMGAPSQPTPAQRHSLEDAGKLTALEAPAMLPVKNGVAALKFDLPREAVSLVIVTWNAMR